MKITSVFPKYIAPGLPLISEEMIAQMVRVTPELAAMLMSINTNNFRTLNQNTIDLYTREMREGRWGKTASTISINTKGVLHNGQHRLTAVMNSGIAQDFLICVGEPVKAGDLIDIGVPRSAGLILQNIYGYKYATTLGAAANGIRLLLENNTKKVSPRDLLANYIRPNEPEILDVCSTTKTTGRIMNGFVLGPMTLAFKKFTKGQKEACVDQLLRGHGLQSGTTLTALRSYLLRENQKNVVGGDTNRVRALKVLTALMYFHQGVDVPKIYEQESLAFKYFHLESRIPKRPQVRRPKSQQEAT